MAQITRIIEMLACDKCLLERGKERRATQQVTLTFLGEAPTTRDLCSTHAQSLRRWVTKQGGATKSAKGHVETTCPICGQVFPTTYAAGQHTKNAHSEYSTEIARLRQILRNRRNGSDSWNQAQTDLQALYDRAREEWQKKNPPQVTVADVTEPVAPDTTEQVHV